MSNFLQHYDNTNAINLYKKFYNNDKQLLKKEDELSNLNVLTEDKLTYLNEMTIKLKMNLENYDGILQEIEYYKNDKTRDQNLLTMTTNTFDDVKIYNFVMKGITRGKIEYYDGIKKLNHCVDKIMKKLYYISIIITFNVNSSYIKSKELEEIKSIITLIDDYNNPEWMKLVRFTVQKFIKNLNNNLNNYDHIIRHILYNHNYYKDQYLHMLLHDLYLQMKKFNNLVKQSKTEYNTVLETAFITTTENILQILYSIGTVITKIYNNQQLLKNYPVEKVSSILIVTDNNTKKTINNLINVVESLLKDNNFLSDSELKTKLFNNYLTDEHENLQILTSLLMYTKNYISTAFYNKILNFIKNYNN